MLVFSTALSIPKSFNLPVGLWATHPTYLHTSAYFPLGSTCCLFMENWAMAMITLNSNGGILLCLFLFFFSPKHFLHSLLIPCFHSLSVCLSVITVIRVQYGGLIRRQREKLSVKSAAASYSKPSGANDRLWPERTQ